MRRPLRARLLFPAGVVAALAVLLAWLFGHLGGGSMGTGTGRQSLPDSTVPVPSSPARQATAPLQVVIREDRYLVRGVDMPLEQVRSAAEAGKNNAIAVKIVTGPDSRLGAERDLENALDHAHLAWALETGPATQPE